jgi:hypothetical protein
MHSREQSGFVVRYAVRKAIAAYSAPMPMANISQKGPARGWHTSYRVSLEAHGLCWRSRDRGGSSGRGPNTSAAAGGPGAGDQRARQARGTIDELSVAELRAARGRRLDKPLMTRCGRPNHPCNLVDGRSGVTVGSGTVIAGRYWRSGGVPPGSGPSAPAG